MNRKRNRKAFTIVELVIVIAVIAVLAAVLVPTFSDVIAKSQDSKALQEAKSAYTNYVIESDGDTPAFMVYQLDERFVAIHNGVPIGVFADKESALGAMMVEYDVNDLADTAIEMLWIYEAADIGNEEPIEVIEDSLSFTPIPEAEEFVQNATLPVVRVFDGAYEVDILEGKTFQDCMESRYAETYIVYDFTLEKEFRYVVYYVAKSYSTEEVNRGMTQSSQEFVAMYLYALSAHSLFEATPFTRSLSSLEINEVYCWVTIEKYSSILQIYFVTNYGDFVYYAIDTGGAIDVLVPAPVFYELAKEYSMGPNGFPVLSWPEKYQVGEINRDECISNIQKQYIHKEE